MTREEQLLAKHLELVACMTEEDKAKYKFPHDCSSLHMSPEEKRELERYRHAIVSRNTRKRKTTEMVTADSAAPPRPLVETEAQRNTRWENGKWSAEEQARWAKGSWTDAEWDARSAWRKKVAARHLRADKAHHEARGLPFGKPQYASKDFEAKGFEQDAPQRRRWREHFLRDVEKGDDETRALALSMAKKGCLDWCLVDATNEEKVRLGVGETPSG